MLDLECSNIFIWPGKLSNGVASTLSKLDAVIIRKINILKIDILIYIYMYIYFQPWAEGESGCDTFNVTFVRLHRSRSLLLWCLLRVLLDIIGDPLHIWELAYKYINKWYKKIE